MIILVINCGSSSIKYQLLDMQSDDVFDLKAKGIVEKIGLETGQLQHKPAGKEKVVRDLPIADHKVGMQIVLDALVDKDFGVLHSFSDIEAVGHRIVQGADFFSGSALVDEEVIRKIDICCDFAPLHNPAHLLGIRACQEVLPDVPQVVTFDTAFHQTMPAYAFMYGLPYSCYEKYHIRRYGAHGTSHQFVARKGAGMVGIDLNASKIITCHIGNGSSITAVQNGKSIDTSMGLTPLEGLLMGTRCGDIDANAILHIMKKENLTADQMYEIVNKKSGLLGLSGKTSDMREMREMALAGDERAQLILDMLVYQITKYVGAYTAAMDGVDAIFFTGGIGEHNDWLRSGVCSRLNYLGVKIDAEANTAWGVDTVISTPDSKVKVALVTTDEELVIARDTMHIAQELKK